MGNVIICVEDTDVARRRLFTPEVARAIQSAANELLVRSTPLFGEVVPLKSCVDAKGNQMSGVMRYSPKSVKSGGADFRFVYYRRENGDVVIVDAVMFSNDEPCVVKRGGKIVPNHKLDTEKYAVTESDKERFYSQAAERAHKLLAKLPIRSKAHS